MYRSLLASAVALALTGAASGQPVYVDGDGDGGDAVEQGWRGPVPPRGIGPDGDTEVIVRRPPPRHVEGPHGGVVIHERTVTERTIVPARPHGRHERADWDDGDDDVHAPRGRVGWDGPASVPGYGAGYGPAPGYGRPPGYGGAPGYGAASGYGDDAGPAPVALDRPVVVGSVIPHRVVLTPVPPRYGFAGHVWVADPYGRRIVVEPRSRRVVRIVERW